jgi:hypothetical protein
LGKLRPYEYIPLFYGFFWKSPPDFARRLAHAVSSGQKAERIGDLRSVATLVKSHLLVDDAVSPRSPAVTPAKKKSVILAIGTTDTSWNMPLTR